jgi:hypothetical protein
MKTNAVVESLPLRNTPASSVSVPSVSLFFVVFFPVSHTPQLPAFLNPNISAPTHPNGAEVWSGYGLKSGIAMEGMYNATVSGAPATVGFVGPNGPSPGGNGDGNGFVPSGFAPYGSFEPHGGGKFEQVDGGVGPHGYGSGGDGQQWENWTFSGDSLKGLTPTGGAYGYPSHHGLPPQPPSHQQHNMQQAYPSSSSPPRNPQHVQASFGGRPVHRPAQNGKSTAASQQTMTVSIPTNNIALAAAKSTPTMPTSALLPSASSGWQGSANAYRQGQIPPHEYNNTTNGGVNAFASSSSLSNAVPASAILAQSNNLNGMVQPDTLAVTNQTPANGNASMPGLYSQTGFDMIGVLARVAARRDPKTVLGPVDCSCSFLVVVSLAGERSVTRVLSHGVVPVT